MNLLIFLISLVFVYSKTKKADLLLKEEFNLDLSFKVNSAWRKKALVKFYFKATNSMKLSYSIENIEDEEILKREIKKECFENSNLIQVKITSKYKDYYSSIEACDLLLNNFSERLSFYFDGNSVTENSLLGFSYESLSEEASFSSEISFVKIQKASSPDISEGVNAGTTGAKNEEGKDQPKEENQSFFSKYVSL